MLRIAWAGGTCSRILIQMQIEITDDARRVLDKKGGTMSIDFIRPTG